MTEVVADQDALQCQACGGQQGYDPASKRLVCASCGAETRIMPRTRKRADIEKTIDLGSAEAVDLPTSGPRHHTCRNCGGEVVFSGAVVSTNCPYCNGPVVLGEEDVGYASVALIPFGVEEKSARENAIAWAKKRMAVPGGFQKAVEAGRIAGLYVPFFTFDSHEEVDYVVRYRETRGEDTVAASSSGKMPIRFDDEAVPASPLITPVIRDGILHGFDPRELKAYGPEYLAGFAAERHHQSIADGIAAHADDKELMIRDRVAKSFGGGPTETRFGGQAAFGSKSGVRVVRMSHETQSLAYRRILLPVWILHYEIGGAPYRIAVSGINGRTFGERPFAKGKIIALSAMISAATIALGVFWGWARVQGL